MKKNRESVDTFKEETNTIKAEKQTKPMLKKILIAAGGLVVVAAIVYGVIYLIKPNQEEELDKILNSLGKDFYETYYYEQIGDTKAKKEEFLKKFEEIGIKINLDNLSRFDIDGIDKKISEFVNKDTDKECDRDNTRVIIYPHSPFEKKSYRIETEIVCGFEE